MIIWKLTNAHSCWHYLGGFVQNFLEAEVKQNTKTKTESYVLDLSNGFSCCWNENRQLGDLPQADFGRVHENTSLSIRKKSTTENFVKRKLRSSSVSVMVRRIFSSWALSRTRFTIFFSGIVKFQFSFYGKVGFSSQWRPIVSIW